MKKIAAVLFTCFLYSFIWSQTVSDRLLSAFTAFEKDSQLSSGISSLYVLDAKTGKVVFEKNAKLGMAPASTQKIITSASAYELLGKDFRYKTEFGYTGKLEGTALKGNILVRPSGDPTLGSWRWNNTKEDAVLNRITAAYKKTGIKSHWGIYVDQKNWDSETIPDGWIWQDIGNYYGAGATGINWRENQFDIVLQSSGELGSSVKVVNTIPAVYKYLIHSKVTAAAKGTGDNAYVYYPLQQGVGIVRGTIPIGEKAFTISAASPDAKRWFSDRLGQTFLQMGGGEVHHDDPPLTTPQKIIHTETSPPLDSIIYWFNKKSINLYGEALVKTIAYQKKGIGDTDEGVSLIKNFWKSKGLDDKGLNIVDGSGLSPLNRVTTQAQVFILQYAKKQAWFSGFYFSLPEYNGMKMKSGTIRGAKGFCGYHISKDGNEYIFSFLVNNYNGSASAIVRKMYNVLDVLK